MLKIIFENRAAKLVDLKHLPPVLCRLLKPYEQKSYLGNKPVNF